MTSPDVLIVGGGAIGVCCALELSRQGADVTLLESGAELGAGCSAGSAGLLCPSHAAPLATRAALRHGLRWSLTRHGPFAMRLRPSLLPWLARFAAACTPARERAATDVLRELSVASLELHERLRDEADTGTERLGTLNVYETEAGFDLGRREAVEHARAGLREHVLSAAEASELEPALAGPIAGAIYYPDEMSGDPLAFVQAVGFAAVDAGAAIRTRTEVLGLRTAGRRIAKVETTAGDLAAGTVVLAAGAWTPTPRPRARALDPRRRGQGISPRLRSRRRRPARSHFPPGGTRGRNADAATAPARGHARARRARPLS